MPRTTRYFYVSVMRVANRAFKLNPVLTFWIAYILTRPLGASLGDWFSQLPEDGGLGLGSVGTSALFLVAIALMVTYLAVTKKDASAIEMPDSALPAKT